MALFQKSVDQKFILGGSRQSNYSHEFDKANSRIGILFLFCRNFVGGFVSVKGSLIFRGE